MSDIPVSNNDLRVFDRLRNELDAFDLGLTDIPVLIRSIGELLDSFEDVPTAFVEELRQVWWPIQYTLALSRDEERAMFEEEEIQARDAAAVLRQHLAELDLPAR